MLGLSNCLNLLSYLNRSRLSTLKGKCLRAKKVIYIDDSLKLHLTQLLNVLKDSILHMICFYQFLHSILNIMYKNLVNKGENYQPQLVQDSSINSINLFRPKKTKHFLLNPTLHSSAVQLVHLQSNLQAKKLDDTNECMVQTQLSL